MLLRISTYKYIHFSHLAFGEKSYPLLRIARQEMGSESRLEQGRDVGAMPAITSLMGGKRREGGSAHDWMDNRIRAKDWLCDQGL